MKLSIAASLFACSFCFSKIEAAEITDPALRGSSGTSEANDEALQDFKEDNFLLPSADTPTQQVSASGTVSANGKTYSVVDDLQEFKIYTDDASISVNGEPRPLEDSNTSRTRVFKGKGPVGETVLVAKKEGEVQSVNIFVDGSEFASMEAVGDGTLASIRPEDFDMERLKQFPLGDIETEFIEDEEMYREELSQNNGGRSLQVKGSCKTYKEVEVAIAYDSTFCAQVAGNDENMARSVVEQAVARASVLYEPMCVLLRVTHLEGFCDPWKDPYVQAVQNAYHIGCSGGKGTLQNFQNIWETSRADVHRDTAHFFIGKAYPGSVIGCAYIQSTPSLCGSYSYGVNQLSFTKNRQLQGNLFAHELGHNMGAGHFFDNNRIGEFLMEPYINSARNGLNPVSQNSIQNYLNRKSCVSTVERGSQIENVKNTNKCVTAQGPLEAGTKINLEPCDDLSPNQRWIVNDETKAIQSAFADNMCIRPNTMQRLSRLALGECENGTEGGQFYYEENERQSVHPGKEIEVHQGRCSFFCRLLRRIFGPKMGDGCLDAMPDDQSLIVFECHYSSNQKWFIR
ncbi:unnamed protein product [Cylindrotheca closterium]|uniref:Peptidase M12B domain-containing protein n=1 Tax=Cylindrotheca closterium TaxID=2856 RepID=A0AAD2PVN4_9STRA|nr:unnamed protein product [Cylindrotheca closterium]